MCGIVGMFTGCTAVRYCPKDILLRGRTGAGDASPDEEDRDPDRSRDGEAWQEPAEATGPHSAYRSPFRSWDERATVRATARRELPPDTGGQLFFSPELVPVARHEAVTGLRPDLYREVLVQHLYRYLDFTMKLEQVVVNRTALGIAQGTVGLRLDPAMRLDAHRIYCDEAYHALFSADLTEQTFRRTDIAPRVPDTPYFLRRLARVQEEAGPGLRALAELVFVIVSETLISANLSEVPDDPRVVPTVFEVMRDHAVDEGRHHTFFALFLKELWAQSDAATRRAIALFVPDMIDAFLRPDEDAIRAELTAYGLHRDEAERVLAEVFPELLVRKTQRDAAGRTVRYFVQLGALDDPEVREAFEKHGLVS